MSPRIVATLQAEDAASRLREEAAHRFHAEVTDKVLYVGQVKPLEVAHRAGRDGKTRCGTLLVYLYAVTSQQAIDNVMQACPKCGFEEHR